VIYRSASYILLNSSALFFLYTLYIQSLASLATALPYDYMLRRYSAI
jgi:hypothetical protein